MSDRLATIDRDRKDGAAVLFRWEGKELVDSAWGQRVTPIAALSFRKS